MVNFTEEPNCFGSHKQTQSDNFTNILRAAFLYISVLRSVSVLTVWVCNFMQKDIGTKAASKLLVKLTTKRQREEEESNQRHRFRQIKSL